MGFYIRKALRVGPLRFNLSKSGIGVSGGITGLRLGTGPRGNYVHMGRGGLYFRRSLSAPRDDTRVPSGGAAQPSRQPIEGPQATVGPMVEIESASVAGMTDSSSADLLAELNEKRKLTRLVPVVAVVGAIAVVLAWTNGAPTWAILLTLGLFGFAVWWASQKDQLRKTTVILYELDADVESRYEVLHEACRSLASCRSLWHIESQGQVREKKYHAGASAVVKRSATRITVGSPPFVRSNVEVPLLAVGRQTLAFMPDRLLVFEATAVGAVSYGDLRTSVSVTRFIEDGSPPSDATVVDRTWKYVNKKGGPDKRFKDNRELPICAYDELHFSSVTGLNELVQASKRGAGEPFAQAVRGLASSSDSDDSARAV